MANAKKAAPSQDEAPKTPSKRQEGEDYPLKKGQTPKEAHLDINNPEHGNKTYQELQDEANR